MEDLRFAAVLVAVAASFLALSAPGTSASSQIDVTGRVIFWNNTSVVDSASVTISIQQRGDVLNDTSTTTNSTGHYEDTIHAGLTSGEQYTLNVTATKGDMESYLLQRFRHE